MSTIVETTSSLDEDDEINPLSRFINIEKKVKIISTKRKTTTKTKKELNHEIINYKDKQYVVCCIPFNKSIRCL